MIRLFAFDELNDEVCVTRCEILENVNLSREEKTAYAEFLVERYKEKYPEYRYFHFEKDKTYFDTDACFEWALSIAEDEEGLEGEEAIEYAENIVRSELDLHYDLGFDF